MDDFGFASRKPFGFSYFGSFMIFHLLLRLFFGQSFNLSLCDHLHRFGRTFAFFPAPRIYLMDQKSWKASSSLTRRPRCSRPTEPWEFPTPRSIAPPQKCRSLAATSSNTPSLLGSSPRPLHRQARKLSRIWTKCMPCPYPQIVTRP